MGLDPVGMARNEEHFQEIEKEMVSVFQVVSSSRDDGVSESLNMVSLIPLLLSRGDILSPELFCAETKIL